MPAEYKPAEYWGRRLAAAYNLRGTGHVVYSEAYNRWLYRRKRAVLRRALAGMPAGARALDVGSGTGWVVGELLRAGAQVEACELVPEAVARLATDFPDVSVFPHALGAEALPRPDGSFELVTLVDVAYHLTDEAAWETGLRELARVLRPGGRLVVTDALGDAGARPAPQVAFRPRAAWDAAGARLGLRVAAVFPLFSWLSRDRDARAVRHLPDGARGAVEFGLERLAPRRPHLRCAVLVKEAR